MPSCTISQNGGYRTVMSVSEITPNATDKSRNQSRVKWSLYMHKGSGSGKWADGPHNWGVRVNSPSKNIKSGSISSYDFRNYSTRKLGSGTVTVKHASNGTKTISFSAAFTDNATWGELGSGSCSGSYKLTNINVAKVPSAVPKVSFDRVTQTSLRHKTTAPSNNGASIIEYQYQLRMSGGTFITDYKGSATYRSVTGLLPNRVYNVRARARNSVGWGGWGSWSYAPTTLPMAAPTVAVEASPVGTSAILSLTRGDTLNPDYWKIERDPGYAGVPVYTDTTTVNPRTQIGLVRGETYRWRAAGVITRGGAQGSSTSPFGSWVTSTMPKPNTEAGDYFDGDTTAGADIDYVWYGTPHASASAAQGKKVLGWRSSALPGLSGGQGKTYRTTGGRTGRFAATNVITTDTTQPGMLAGTLHDGTDVVPGAFYTGSIYVRMKYRTQRLAATVYWGINPPDRVDGDGQIVPAGTGWTRLTVTAQIPSGITSAGVGVVDVGGDGWAPWISGDVMQLDDAMITLGGLFPYFDGNTKNVPQYEYEWEGTENKSKSSRTERPLVESDPLADPDCPPIPAAPAPPIVVDPCLIDVGLWRRYWAVIPQALISQWLAVIPTITLTTGGDPARQVRIRVYPNPDDVEPTQFFESDPMGEQTISYMPPNAEYILDGVTERVRGRVDSGEWVEADHLLYGTLGTPATWPVLSCGVGYLISFDVPDDAPDGNLNIDVELTRRF